MAGLSRFLPRVHDEFPAVPEKVALRALSDSVREFCRRTHSWQESLPSVRTRPDRTEFALSPDTGLIVVALKDVRTSTGERIPPYAGELTRLLTQRLPASAQPLGFVQRSWDVIELVNATDTIQQLTVKAALSLADGTTSAEIPDSLAEEYGEALAAGAKLRLVKQANTPWFAPDAAALYAGSYYQAINESKARVLTSMGEADMRVEMRSW